MNWIKNHLFTYSYGPFHRWCRYFFFFLLFLRLSPFLFDTLTLWISLRFSLTNRIVKWKEKKSVQQQLTGKEYSFFFLVRFFAHISYEYLIRLMIQTSFEWKQMNNGNEQQLKRITLCKKKWIIIQQLCIFWSLQNEKWIYSFSKNIIYCNGREELSIHAPFQFKMRKTFAFLSSHPLTKLSSENALREN